MTQQGASVLSRDGPQGAGITPYAATIFISATLLFLIQPMIAKEVLPWFGGAAAVWGTCMVFFQCLLLLSYFYAYASIRWRTARTQASVHVALLAFGSATLLFPSAHRALASTAAHPMAASLQFLSVRIGLPYFVLASTSPLLQAWYSRGQRRALPYRLFALSNLSSLLALVAYPFVVEPTFDLDGQFTAWRQSYAAFGAFCGWIAFRTAGRVGISPGSAVGHPVTGGNWMRNLRWAALSCCSSALLLGVTNNLCQNIAPMPLMWIAPLVLYLVSFVLCFDRDGWFSPSVYRFLVPCALVGLLWTDSNPELRANVAIPFCLSSLLVVCMFCHGELSVLKPGPSELTSFYLYLAAGGALGAVFVGFIAPVLFSELFELRVAIAVCLALSLRFLFGYRSKVFLLGTAAGAIVLFHAVLGSFGHTTTVFRGRNFYGALAVTQSRNAAGEMVRVMVNGRVVHGGQLLEPSERLEPRYYYGRESGVGIALQRPRSNRRAGIVGLGTGTIGAYGRPGDFYRFYEINPMVTETANRFFTYLRDSRARISVSQGDARLALDREAAQHFDTIVLDAFSGDSVPVHLLTLEAFRIYFRHLNDDGILAVNVSSQYLDLVPVVAEVAATLGRSSLVVESPGHADQYVSHAIWVLVTKDGPFLDEVRRSNRGEMVAVGRQRPWTDRYSNILTALR